MDNIPPDSLPVIFSIKGIICSCEEKELLSSFPPWGLIINKNNLLDTTNFFIQQAAVKLLEENKGRSWKNWIEQCLYEAKDLQKYWQCLSDSSKEKNVFFKDLEQYLLEHNLLRQQSKYLNVITLFYLEKYSSISKVSADLVEDIIDYEKQYHLAFNPYQESLEVIAKYSLQHLTTELKEMMPNVQILIDMEGGRVNRLKCLAKEYANFPTAATLGQLPFTQIQQNYFEIGKVLADFDIDINCAPVGDILTKDTTTAIGDRSFGYEASKVTQGCQAALQGLAKAGVKGVMKHLPTHGLAKNDTHLATDTIYQSKEELKKFCLPFIECAHLAEFAMTAHLIFQDLDCNLPATLSAANIKFIREEIGFKGLLMTDDLAMKALSRYGSIPELAEQSLKAGCNLALYCAGELEVMQDITKRLLNIN